MVVVISKLVFRYFRQAKLPLMTLIQSVVYSCSIGGVLSAALTGIIVSVSFRNDGKSPTVFAHTAEVLLVESLVVGLIFSELNCNRFVRGMAVLAAPLFGGLVALHLLRNSTYLYSGRFRDLTLHQLLTTAVVGGLVALVVVFTLIVAEGLRTRVRPRKCDVTPEIRGS